MTLSTPKMPGTFVVSLDFELMWGVRDKRTVDSYGDAVSGERRAIPEMLRRFRAHGVRATWAAVGMTLARDRQSMLDSAPALKPQYDNRDLSPYPSIEREIGEDEDSDPLHFGYDLVSQVAAVEGQEVGTHTFSHFYCLEPGQTLAAFEADLEAAIRIARKSDLPVRSIVFPRNQMTAEHIEAARRLGIDCYRGNPDTFAYRARNEAENSSLVRAVRLIDSVLPVDGHHGYRLEEVEAGPFNIPGSRFLRPHTRRAPALSALQLRRVMAEMTHAARAGRMYHLWWHPHNFGRNTDANLAGLDRILGHLDGLRETYGMTSANMGDLAARRLSVVAA